MQGRNSRVCLWLAAAASFVAGLFPFNTTDGYGHLAVGRQIATLGHVPRFDLFSYWKPTPQPWHNFSWGYDLGSWWLYSAGGANTLILLKCAALAFLGASLVALAVRLGKPSSWAAPLALTLLLLALPVVRFRLTVRPQLFGLLIPLLLLWGLWALMSERTSRRRRFVIVFALALAHVVWVNVHGSHLFGLLLTGIFATFSFRTPAFAPAALLVVLQGLAMGCTPFGFGIVFDSVSLLSQPEYRDLLLEWEPWSPKVPLALLAIPVLYAVLTLFAVGPMTRSGRYGLAYSVLCIVLTLMAFRSLRFIAHQLLLATPFIAAGIGLRLQARRIRAPLVLVPAAIALVGVLWAPGLAPFLGFGLGEPRTDYPWVAARVIDEQVPEPYILANARDGWMLAFAVPNAKLLIDGRAHFFGAKFLRFVEDSFETEASFAGLLRDYPTTNAVVVDHVIPKHFAAINYLRASPDWQLAQVEDRHSLFLRRPVLGGRAFTVLDAGFRPGRVLDVDVSDEEIDTEVARIGRAPSTVAVLAWVQGLRDMRPLARDGGRAGFRMARDDNDSRSARAAYQSFTRAADVQPEFNAIELLRGMAASSLCDIELARTSFDVARSEGPHRPTALAEMELALRSPNDGERASAHSQLKTLEEHPSSRDDPWVKALVADVQAGVRCAHSHP